MLLFCVYVEEYGKFLVLWMLLEVIVIFEIYDGEGVVCKCIVSLEIFYLEVSWVVDVGYIVCCLFIYLKFLWFINFFVNVGKFV